MAIPIKLTVVGWNVHFLLVNNCIWNVLNLVSF